MTRTLQIFCKTKAGLLFLASLEIWASPPEDGYFCIPLVESSYKVIFVISRVCVKYTLIFQQAIFCTCTKMLSHTEDMLYWKCFLKKKAWLSSSDEHKVYILTTMWNSIWQASQLNRNKRHCISPLKSPERQYDLYKKNLRNKIKK